MTQRIIGLDIGGSKTRGILWEDERILADATVGSANVQNVSIATAQNNLGALFAQLLPAGSPPVQGVFAGSGGIDTPADAEALAVLIRPQIPGASVTIVHDTRLLLAAGGASSGVAVIAGTGSAAWGVNAAGQQARAGGWGYLLGDEGSGYWFGREAVRYTLHRMDQELPTDSLSNALLERCELSEPRQLIAHFHAGNSDPSIGRRYWAAMSPVIFQAADAGHEAAQAMITQAGEDLANLATQVAQAINVSGPIILGSGLGSNQPRLQEAFRDSMQHRGFTDIQILQQDPIFGVLELARQT